MCWMFFKIRGEKNLNSGGMTLTSADLQSDPRVGQAAHPSSMKHHWFVKLVELSSVRTTWAVENHHDHPLKLMNGSVRWSAALLRRTRSSAGVRDTQSQPRHDSWDCHRTAAPWDTPKTTPTDWQSYGSPMGRVWASSKADSRTPRLSSGGTVEPFGGPCGWFRSVQKPPKGTLVFAFESNFKNLAIQLDVKAGQPFIDHSSHRTRQPRIRLGRWIPSRLQVSSPWIRKSRLVGSERGIFVSRLRVISGSHIPHLLAGPSCRGVQ